MSKIVVEWTDRDGKHHMKILSSFSANRYVQFLNNAGYEVMFYAA